MFRVKCHGAVVSYNVRYRVNRTFPLTDKVFSKRERERKKNKKHNLVKYSTFLRGEPVNIHRRNLRFVDSRSTTLMYKHPSLPRLSTGFVPAEMPAVMGFGFPVHVQPFSTLRDGLENIILPSERYPQCFVSSPVSAEHECVILYRINCHFSNIRGVFKI